MEYKVYDNYIKKLKKVIQAEYLKGNYEKCLRATKVCARTLYEVNQVYVDDYLEGIINKVQKKVLGDLTTDYSKKDKVVLFYDAFGTNIRGLAQIYVKALCELKKEMLITDVIYVGYADKEKQIPDIKKIVQSCHGKLVFIDKAPLVEQMKALKKIIKQSMPEKMFFYSLPEDVVGVAAFECYKGKIARYQINLTDHAYWLGRDALDYSVEFRDYGASISKYNRLIDEKKLVKLPYYPLIDLKQQFCGFPFDEDISMNKLIFSGGSLYKTISNDNRYYKIVDYILSTYPDTLFWYAGEGDRTEMDKLIKKYPKRIVLTKERQDLYQVLKKCYFYLSTYPLCGGLMFQYAAKAGKIPITLKSSEISDGFLINQNELNIEFDNIEDLYIEIDKLFKDRLYKKNKEELLKSNVITPLEFKDELYDLISNNKTSFDIRLEQLDTQKTRQQYLDRVTTNNLCEIMINRKNVFLLRYFPIRFVKGSFLVIRNKLKNMFD